MALHIVCHAILCALQLSIVHYGYGAPELLQTHFYQGAASCTCQAIFPWQRYKICRDVGTNTGQKKIDIRKYKKKIENKNGDYLE